MSVAHYSHYCFLIYFLYDSNNGNSCKIVCTSIFLLTHIKSDKAFMVDICKMFHFNDKCSGEHRSGCFREV